MAKKIEPIFNADSSTVMVETGEGWTHIEANPVGLVIKLMDQLVALGKTAAQLKEAIDSE